MSHSLTCGFVIFPLAKMPVYLIESLCFNYVYVKHLFQSDDKRGKGSFQFTLILSNLVICLGQKFVTWVGSGQFFVARVWVRIWKISPNNVKFFNFFSLRFKKISSGWVKKYPDGRQVTLLFTAGQK